MNISISKVGSVRFYRIKSNGEFDCLHNMHGPAVKWFFSMNEYWVNNVEYDSYLEYLVAVEEYKKNMLTLC